MVLGQEIAGSNNWVYFEPFTPTDDPLRQLDPPLTPLFKGGWGDQTPIILIIDQFEECFTMCAEKTRKAFIDRLTGLIETKPNLQLIIGMRSDFRGRLREYPEFAQKMSKVNVEHLNREEIREAIEKPAEFVGLGIEGSLKQQLINDVEDYPGSLPLLQYTLTQLWNEARKQGEQFLRLETYQQLGGIEGTLEKRADAVYESLSPEEQAVAKRIFLELTQVGDTLDTRRRVQLGDLVNSHHSLEILDTVTQKLANKDNRLITRTEIDEEISQVSENSSQSEIRSPLPPLKRGENAKSKIIIDVVHEALIRHWKRLGDWKQEYQAAMVVERKIEASAQEWEKGGRKNEDLLQKSRLAEAEGYLKDFSELGMLDGMAEEYVTLSQKHRRKVRRNWLVGGIVGGIILISLTIWASISSLQSRKLALNAELQQQATSVKYGLSVEPTTEELIQAIETTAKSQDQQKSLEAKVISEVQSSLLAALDQVRERNLLQGHTGTVTAIAFSPDGKQILSGSDDNTVRLWDRESGKLVHTLEGHTDSVTAIAFSPDGKQILSGSRDKTVRLWDSESGKLVHTLEGHTDIVRAIAFSPDGKKILSGSNDKTVRLWRNYTWQEALTEGCNHLQFHPALIDPKNELAGEACLKYAGWDERAKAYFLVRQGRSFLRNEQNVKGAVTKFNEAQKLQSDIDLNPDTKEIDKNPQIVAQYLAALFKVQEGVKLAKEGKIKEAVTAYQEAQEFDPKLNISAESWNSLCWFGSLNKQAADVLFACENAVKLASAENKPLCQDSRGLARALTGDKQGAIADFQALIADPNIDKTTKAQRQQWIEALKKGENPFTDKVLEGLKNE